MSDKAFVAAFNKTLSKLIDEIIALYPDLKEFKGLRSSFNMAKMATPELVIMLFKKQTAKFMDKIKAKDSDFFLSIDVKGTPVEPFMHLKEIYVSATEETKECIWKYIFALTKLSQKYSK